MVVMIAVLGRVACWAGVRAVNTAGEVPMFSSVTRTCSGPSIWVFAGRGEGALGGGVLVAKLFESGGLGLGVVTGDGVQGAGRVQDG